VRLSAEQMTALSETFAHGVTAGDRYAPAGMTTVEH
jgi:hypothetical protein